MTAHDAIADLFAPVRPQLDAVEQRLLEVAPNEHEALREATEHLVAAGGKRARPAVTLMVAGVYAADWERSITLGAAIEMLHTATLVHDDLIDGALLRRGMPTLNAQWTPAATVLTGDYLFARAAGLAAQTDSVRVMDVFARTLAVMVNGEINQLFKSRGKASREDYFDRIYAKTASMFELACEAAGLLGQASEEDLALLADLGRQMGMAFQIVDDILDFVGTSDKVGKPVGNDLHHGLVTLPALCYMEMNPDDEDVRALLNGKFGDRAVTARVVEATRNSNAVDMAMTEAQAYVERSMVIIDSLPQNEFTNSLRDTVAYFTNRSY